MYEAEYDTDGEDEDEIAEMVPISATVPYDQYLELEDQSDLTETSMEEVIRDAIDLYVLVKQHLRDEEATGPFDWIDQIERSTPHVSREDPEEPRWEM